MEAYEKGRVWLLKVPTHNFWLSQQFMVGLSYYHGAIVKQDWALPIQALIEVQALLELEWKHVST